MSVLFLEDAHKIWGGVESVLKNDLEIANIFTDDEVRVIVRSLVHYECKNYSESVNKVCFVVEKLYKEKRWLKKSSQIESRLKSCRIKSYHHKSKISQEDAEFCLKEVIFSDFPILNIDKDNQLKDKLKLHFDANFVFLTSFNNSHLNPQNENLFPYLVKGKTFLDFGLWDEAVINLFYVLERLVYRKFYCYVDSGKRFGDAIKAMQEQKKDICRNWQILPQLFEVLLIALNTTNKYRRIAAHYNPKLLLKEEDAKICEQNIIQAISFWFKIF